MGQKHVAKSGASAGQWVTCKAQKQCPNGGEHISADTLKTVSEKTYTRIKDLTESDVLSYLGKTPASPAKAENNLTEAASEAEKDQVKVPQYKSYQEYANILKEKLNAYLTSKNLLREGETVLNYSSTGITHLEYAKRQGTITTPGEESNFYGDDEHEDDYDTSYFMNIDFQLSSGRTVSDQGEADKMRQLLSVKL